MSKIDQMSPQERADLEKLSPDVRALVEKFGWETFEGKDSTVTDKDESQQCEGQKVDSGALQA